MGRGVPERFGECVVLLRRTSLFSLPSGWNSASQAQGGDPGGHGLPLLAPAPLLVAAAGGGGAPAADDGIGAQEQVTQLILPSRLSSSQLLDNKQTTGD